MDRAQGESAQSRSRSGDRAAYRKPAEVKADLVGATVELLGERLPRDLTVRAIAERAGTQHSMITRHFGSKDELVAEAYGVVVDGYVGAVRDASDPRDGFVAALEHVRGSSSAMLMVALASPDRPVGGAEPFPGYAAHLRQMLDAGAADDLRTRVVAGLAIGTVVAWSVMEGLVLTAAGVPDAPRSEVDGIVREVLGDLVGLAGGGLAAENGEDER